MIQYHPTKITTPNEKNINQNHHKKWLQTINKQEKNNSHCDPDTCKIYDPCWDTPSLGTPIQSSFYTRRME
jgi:hypothetical protein